MRIARLFPAVFGIILVLGTSLTGLAATGAAAAGPRPSGPVHILHQLPSPLRHSGAKYLGRRSASAPISVNVGLPLRNFQQLNQLIVQESRTHVYLTRAQLYQRFSPTPAQFRAVQNWLTGQGYAISYSSPDRLLLGIRTTTGSVESLLHVQINNYVAPSTGQRFYSNATAPTLPGGLDIQSISGLNDFDRFHTDAQMVKTMTRRLDKIRRADDPTDGTDLQADPTTPLANTSTPSTTAGPVFADPNANDGATTDFRSGGDYPSDLRSLYDITGHGFTGAGQTIGFTLWGAGVTQSSMTSFATTTGDTAITVDATCSSTGNNNCRSTHPAANHILNILENGNTNNNYAAEGETAMDVEQAHGLATGVAMKYFLGDCSTTSCNPSNTGLEDSISDAANDTSLHVVGNSWGNNGDIEQTSDPFYVATNNSLALAAAAGTTFYFSTADNGTQVFGYPADSPYVVAVGGTALTGTGSGTTPGSYSTEVGWSNSGGAPGASTSGCSNLIPRPAWQTGITASCSGRAVPDISTDGDPNTGVLVVYPTSATANTSGQIGGTSLSTQLAQGMAADTENFIAAQSYPGSPPTMGFAGPVIYQLGNSAAASSYFHSVTCGNDAYPVDGPDGDSAGVGSWNPMMGFGDIDWYNYSIGYAQQLGATGLSTPPSLARTYRWNCDPTPGNELVRGISCPTTSTCYAVGNTSLTTFFLNGAESTFFKSTNGGQSWTAQGEDMTGVSCSSASTCVEVGDGGRIRTTTNTGSTWTDQTSPYNKPLLAISCPSSTICFASGHNGTILKSTNGGTTWTIVSNTADGTDSYGIACPSTSVCYATDVFGGIDKTTDGGNTWTFQSTPVSTGTIAGNIFAISCNSTTQCVTVGQPSSGVPVVLVTTNGGTSWSSATSGTTSGRSLYGVNCIAGSNTCFAVGYGGSSTTATPIYKSTNINSGASATWTSETSGATGFELWNVQCFSASNCITVGNGGLYDITSNGGTTWTAATQSGSPFLIDGYCPDASDCYTVGQQGQTYYSANGGSTWTLQAGGGSGDGTTYSTTTGAITRQGEFNAISCPSATECFAVANAVSSSSAAVIYRTLNGGQSWTAQTTVSGSNINLNGVSCPSVTTCVVVGAGTASAAAFIELTTNANNASGATFASETSNSGTNVTATSVSCVNTSPVACLAGMSNGRVDVSTNGGTTWALSTTGNTNSINAIACQSPTNSPSALVCYAVGASGTVLRTANSGTAWTAQTSNTTQTLNAVACVDALNCYAGGAIGTLISTANAGTTWAQQGNPISGPTTALSTGFGSTTGLYGLNSASCTVSECELGGANGSILNSPILTVTVNASGTYGSSPNLSGLSPSNPAISYNPSGESVNVTGSLTCSTTATNTSTVGSYAITAGSCSGLSDPSYTIVYNYSASSYAVTQATPALAWTHPADITYPTALSNTQLDATASGPFGSVPGSFAYNPGSGAVLHVGASQPLSATFTPTDTVDYVSGGTVGTTINVDQYGPKLSWTQPADITYPTALSGTQLDAQSDVPGTFAYNPTAGTVLHAGSNQPLSATFTPTDTTDYASGGTVGTTITVDQYTPVLAWATPADITYPTALSGTQLDAQSDVPGSFAYNPVAGTVLNAGANQPLSATFTPTDTVDYVSGGTVGTTINVDQYTPVLSWSAPADITYPTALSGTQLDAQSDVPGTFAYNPVAGTVLNAGANQPLSATFTPTDTVDYVSGGTVGTTITVDQYTPVLAWATPADITYPTALSGAQLDAQSDVPGTFAYNPVAGTVLNAGANQPLSATFTPTDTVDYVSGGTVGTTITVDQYTPVLSWTAPADITYPTALSGTQLDAQSDVPGSFAYSPVSGTVLNAGANQPLSATFTPTDTVDYVSGGTVGTTINVDQYGPKLSWTQPADITYPTALSGTQLDAQSDVPGTFAYNPVAGTVLNAGANQPLSATFTPTDTVDYVSGGTVGTTITVDQYTPVLTWTQPADITYPTALSGTQLDAQSDVPGTFAYNPTAGTVLNAESNQPLSATFTPTDTTDYVSGGTVGTTINVDQYTPVLTWSQPADITYPTALSGTQLDAQSDVPGTFAYNPVAGTVLNAGANQPLSATFTPTDTVDYVSGGTVGTTITVDQYTPVLSWSAPADITYPTALSGTQLDAQSDVPGTFAYNPVAGTVLHAGANQPLSATFTPTDTVDYVSGGTVGTTITVDQYTPVLAWTQPVDITYPTALSGTQLDAQSDVPGTFAYNPVAGTVLHAGANQPLSATFTPTDTVDYVSGGTVSNAITVHQATPIISWVNPADITYPTALSGTQLDALASVAGTFAYSPVAGTVLNAGPNQTLSTTFTPSDAVDYTNAGASVHINVLKGSQTITFPSLASVPLAGPAPVPTATAGSGLAVSYTAAGQCSISGTAITLIGAGTCTITAHQAGNGNWNAAPDVSSTFSITLASGLMYVLNGSANGALTASGNATVTAGGNIYVDSTSVTAINRSGNASISATLGGRIYDAGGYTSGCCTPTPLLGSAPDPLAAVVMPSYSGGTWYIGGVAQPARSVPSSPGALQPGVYANGITLGSGAWTMSPGIYIVDGGGLTVSGQASLTGTAGVFIYNTGHAAGSCKGVTISGQASATLTAGAAGPYSGIALAQDRGCTANTTVSGGGKLTANGAVYLPSSAVTLSGNGGSDVFQLLVSDRITVSGNGMSLVKP